MSFSTDYSLLTFPLLQARWSKLWRRRVRLLSYMWLPNTVIWEQLRWFLTLRFSMGRGGMHLLNPCAKKMRWWRYPLQPISDSTHKILFHPLRCCLSPWARHWKISNPWKASTPRALCAISGRVRLGRLRVFLQSSTPYPAVLSLGNSPSWPNLTSLAADWTGYCSIPTGSPSPVELPPLRLRFPRIALVGN